jgi:DNA-binding IclR family transcriptional regulator
MTTVAAPRQRKGIQSFEVGFTVLECIERAGGPLPLTKIAQACGMTMSKVHFYLVSLNRVGLVAQDSVGGQYRLGPAALRLGLSALAQQDVLELARSEMGQLIELTGDTVFLSVWGHSGATVISRFDGVNFAPLAVRVGAALPLLRSATGRIFLAWQPTGHTKPMLRREIASRRKSPLNLRKVASLITEIREEGVAVTPGAIAPEMVAIAAPIFDHTKRLQCVLTLTAQSRRLDEAARNGLALAVRQSAETVSSAAGYQGGIAAPPIRAAKPASTEKRTR